MRILTTARELGIETFAVYTAEDVTHTKGATHALRLKDSASFLDISQFVDLVKGNEIDAVHPGYGFLSESADFARRMWTEANCIVIGPGADVLESTGDKLKAKLLAQECKILPNIDSRFARIMQTYSSSRQCANFRRNFDTYKGH